MNAENTIANRIKQKDPESFDLLQKMIEQPAMFVGINRFDYIYYEFDGYCRGRGTSVEFMPNQELQYWLLHNQSASLSGEIAGNSLFFRCFGIGEIAFGKYKELLYAVLPEKWSEVDINDDPLVLAMASHSQAVDIEIYTHESNYDLVRYDLLNDGIPKDNTVFIDAVTKSIERNGEVRYDWADDAKPDHNAKLAYSIIDNIKKMIENSNVAYDELRIYIRKERLFTQVRFLYRYGQEWSDDSAIIADPDNHDLLIAIHANAKNAPLDALRECGCDVVDKQDYDFMFVPNIIDYADEQTFHSEYLQWKMKFFQ